MATMRLVFNWLVSAVAIIIAAYLLPGVSVDSLATALVLAVVLGAINAFIRPILILLTLPLTIVTLGLFLFILNTFLIQFAALLVPGFEVTSFWTALLFSAVLAVINSVLFRMSAPRPLPPSDVP